MSCMAPQWTDTVALLRGYTTFQSEYVAATCCDTPFRRAQPVWSTSRSCMYATSILFMKRSCVQLEPTHGCRMLSIIHSIAAKD